MKVFKSYIKIVNKHKFTVGLYFLIFVVVVFGMAQSAKGRLNSLKHLSLQFILKMRVIQ